MAEFQETFSWIPEVTQPIKKSDQLDMFAAPVAPVYVAMDLGLPVTQEQPVKEPVAITLEPTDAHKAIMNEVLSYIEYCEWLYNCRNLGTSPIGDDETQPSWLLMLGFTRADTTQGTEYWDRVTEKCHDWEHAQIIAS